VEVSLLLGSIAAFGGYSFGPVSLHGLELARWGGLWFVAFVSVGLSEEYLFRGYAQYTLARGVGFWRRRFSFPFCLALDISGIPARATWEPRGWSPPGFSSLSLCEGLATSGWPWDGMRPLILGRRFCIPFLIAHAL